jgi:hypothetical protein
MSTIIFRILALVLFVVATGSDAQAAPARANVGVGVGVGHHHHHHGHWRWGVGVGVGFGVWPYAYPAYPYGWTPGYVVVEPPVAYERRVIAEPALPAPVFTPKSGQSPTQLEADRRQCDREAMASPAAMADATVFHRIVLVCMENRGYTVR